MKSQDLIYSVYRDLESLNVQLFLNRVTDNIWMRFGNTRPAVGKAAVRERLNELFSEVKKLHFEFTSVWTVPGEEHVVITELTCIRDDNSRFTIPATNVLRFKKGTNLLEEMQIFVDLAPLRKPMTETQWPRIASAFDFMDIHPTH